MKRLLLLVLLMPCMAISVNANQLADNNQKDTVIVVNKPEQVKIKNFGSSISVEVKGSAESPDFYYSTQLELSRDSAIITQERVTDWNVNLPFMNKNKDKRRYKSQITMGGLGFGMVNAVNAPSEMNVNMGSSWEIMMDHWVGYEYFPWKTGTSFSIGVGTTWRNYRMNGMKRFIKDNNKIEIGSYPEDANIEYSRLKIFSITMPLMFNQDLGHKMGFSVGTVVNFNTHGSLKTIYTLNNQKQKLTDNNIHQNSVTVDLMATFKFQSIGLYFKYSPTHVLNTDFGPKFNSLSTGLALFF